MAAARRRHGDAAADVVRVPDRPHARRRRTRWPRSVTCTSTARRPNSSRRSRCRRASTRRAIRNAMYRDPITVDDVLVVEARRRPAAQARLLRDLRRRLLHHPHDRGPRARPRAPSGVTCAARRAASTHHSIAAMADMTRTAAAVSGPKAFAEAGITPADVDMFAMYDSFTYTVLVVLEDLGFAPKGEGGAFITDNGGNLRLGGALPTNTDGGGLSATHPGMRGLFLLCEATRQLRGEAGDARSRAPRSQSRTAAAAGCRRRAPSCSERRRRDVGRLESETPKWLVPRPDARGPRVLGGRTPRRAAHPTLHDVRQAPALRADAVQPLRRADTSSGSPRAATDTVYSFTVMRQNGVPPFNERVPFVVATVDLDEDGARMIGAMPALEPDDARIGMRVRRVPARHRRARLRRFRAPGPRRRRGSAGLRPRARARVRRPSRTSRTGAARPIARARDRRGW